MNHRIVDDGIRSKVYPLYFVVRSVKGLLRFDRRQPMPAGIGWGFG
jgi:hypothetical protein